MLRPSLKTVTLFALALGVMMFGSACSGGGGGSNPPAAMGLRAGNIAIRNQFAQQFGVVGVEFDITGPAGTVYDLLLEFNLPNNAAFAEASPIPNGLANGINAQFPGSVSILNLVGRNLPAADGEPTGTNETSETLVFWWYAGQDLGFINGMVQAFQVTPFSNGMPGTPNGLPSQAPGFEYTAGQPAQTSMPTGGFGMSGAGSGSIGNPPMGSGRAGQQAVFLGGNEIAATGGFNDGTAPNAFNAVDRFSFDPANFSHTLEASLAMAPGMTARALHATAFFLDPTTGDTRALATGGVNSFDPSGSNLTNQLANATIENDTGTVYGLAPSEIVSVASNTMSSSRYLHTATWVPCNEVVLMGGASGTANPTALDVIEHYDPLTNSFVVPMNPTTMTPITMGFARYGHEAALMADGRIFICGGIGTSSQTLPLCEIYDPISGAMTTVTASGSTMARIGHTVTRMANGWLLIVGGRSPLSSALNNTAVVYKPASDTFESMTLPEGRALHTATLLGDKSVLVTGGIARPNGAAEAFTSSAQVFTVEAGSFSFITLYDAMSEARADHSATALAGGTVFILGGRNDTGSSTGLNFLDTAEFFAFSNSVPSVTQGMTAASSASGNLGISFEVADAEQDGGYVIVRYRVLPNGTFCTATISSPTSGNSYPNLEVSPGTVTVDWDYTADGVGPGTAVEIEIIPVGAVLGSAARFNAATPQ